MDALEEFIHRLRQGERAWSLRAGGDEWNKPLSARSIDVSDPDVGVYW